MPSRWFVRSALLLLLASAALRSQSFDELAARARQAAESEQIDQAIGLYTRAVEMRPAWAEGWWRLGGLFYYGGRFAKSLEAFTRFIAVEPKSGPGFAMAGLCEFELRRYDRALVALEQALRLGLRSNLALEKQALYHDAILQSRFGQPDIALKRVTFALNEAAAVRPGAAPRDLLDDVELIDAFGIAALRIPSLPSEVSDEKSALIRKAGRAQALVSLHDWVSAAAEFKELVAEFGSRPGVHYMHGVFLLKEHPSEALAEFEREIRVSPRQPDARIQIALECLRTGEYERGRKNAAEAVALAPDNFVAHLASARLWLALERVDRALDEARLSVKLAPDSPDAHFTLSECYAQANRPEEAERERAEFRRLRALVQTGSQ